MHFADIHTHIIPGIDDGSTSIEETIQMLRLAYDHGTRSIVATPHMFLDLFPNRDAAIIRSKFESVLASLKQYASQPAYSFLSEMLIVLGSENYASLEFVQCLDGKAVLPVNGSYYLLVEFSPFVPFGSMQSIIERILLAGFYPVVAHTERIIAVQQKPARLAPLLNVGCVFQVNADSIVDSATRTARKTAASLLGEGYGHVVASDGHRVNYRPPTLFEVCQKLLGKYDEEQVRTWLWENPSRIIANQPIIR